MNVHTFCISLLYKFSPVIMIPIFVVNPFGASSLAACKHIKKFCASSDHHYKHANVINMVRVGVTDAFALGIHYIVLYYDPRFLS